MLSIYRFHEIFAHFFPPVNKYHDHAKSQRKMSADFYKRILMSHEEMKLKTCTAMRRIISFHLSERKFFVFIHQNALKGQIKNIWQKCTTFNKRKHKKVKTKSEHS